MIHSLKLIPDKYFRDWSCKTDMEDSLFSLCTEFINYPEMSF